MERIHVVGVGPRTGTTLLAECMIACFEIDAFDKHEARLLKFRRNAEIYLSKRPGDLLFVRQRLRLDRHFHVICMLRDPRDMVTSRHAADPARYWVPLRWKHRLVEARRLLHHKRFILLRYEDLATSPDATQAELSRRLPFLRRKAAFSDFHLRAAPSGPALAALGGLRAIDASRVGNWRAHLPRLAGQLAQHGPITRELIEFGYEKDDAWLSVLNGIDPDMTPSHLDEMLTPRARREQARSKARTWLTTIVLLVRRLGRQKIG